MYSRQTRRLCALRLLAVLRRLRSRAPPEDYVKRAQPHQHRGADRHTRQLPLEVAVDPRVGVLSAMAARKAVVVGSLIFDFFDFILEKPATRPRDRCGKEQLIYPFVTGFPGSSRVSALAPYSSGDRVGSTLSTPHAGGDVGLFVGECSSPQTDAPTDDERVRLMSLTPPP